METFTDIVTMLVVLAILILVLPAIFEFMVTLTIALDVLAIVASFFDAIGETTGRTHQKAFTS